MNIHNNIEIDVKATDLEYLTNVRDAVLKLKRKELGTGLLLLRWNPDEKCYIGDVCAVGAYGLDALNIADASLLFDIKEGDLHTQDGISWDYSKTYETDFINTSYQEGPAFDGGYGPEGPSEIQWTVSSITSANDLFSSNYHPRNSTPDKEERYEFMLKWLNAHIEHLNEKPSCPPQGIEQSATSCPPQGINI